MGSCWRPTPRGSRRVAGSSARTTVSASSKAASTSASNSSRPAPAGSCSALQGRKLSGVQRLSLQIAHQAPGAAGDVAHVESDGAQAIRRGPKLPGGEPFGPAAQIFPRLLKGVQHGRKEWVDAGDGSGIHGSGRESMRLLYVMLTKRSLSLPRGRLVKVIRARSADLIPKVRGILLSWAEPGSPEFFRLLEILSGQ